MTQQETIERDFRITLGDLHIQLIVARARIAELEALIAAHVEPQISQPNGGKPSRKEAVTQQ